MPSFNGGVLAEVSVVGGSTIGKFFIAEDNFLWAYKNELEQPAGKMAATGHPPLTMWKRGEFEPFDLVLMIGVYGSPPEEGWVASPDALVDLCQKFAKACMPNPGAGGSSPGKLEPPNRIKVKVGTWFVVVGLAESCKIRFLSPYDINTYKPMTAEITINLKPCSKAKDASSSDKWEVDNSWNFNSMH